MDRTLTLNRQKGQRKQTGKSTYHKKYNTNIENNVTNVQFAIKTAGKLIV